MLTLLVHNPWHSEQESATVVSDDTDVVELLVHHFRPDMSDIYMLSEITWLHSAHACVVTVHAVSVWVNWAESCSATVNSTCCDWFDHGKASVFRMVAQNRDMLHHTMASLVKDWIMCNTECTWILLPLAS